MSRTVRRRILIVSAAMLALVAVMAAGPVPAARAATFVVTRFDDPAPDACNPGDCSLREAIRAANALAGSDMITLSAGTYILSLGPVGDDAALNGDLDIVDSVTIQGAGLSQTIIDGGGAAFGDRIFDIDAPAVSVSISGLTIRNAVTSGPSPGILVDGGVGLTMTDAAVTDMVGSCCAGVSTSDGDLTLTRVNVSGNSATSCCSGIDSSGGNTLMLTDVTVNNNTSTGGGCCTGVSTSGGGTVTLTRGTVNGNTSPGSGCCAGFNTSAGATVTVTDVTINANSTGSGGGCCAGFSASGGGTVTLTNVTVSGNSSAGSCCSGAAVSGSAVNAVMTNVTVSGNSNGDCCAGLLTDGTTTINNATITDNTSDSDGSGGECCSGLVLNGTTSVGNTISAGNRVGAGSTEPDCSGTLTSLGYNLIQDVSGCTITGITTGNILGQDPKLGPLADNGGLTRTHALLTGSPAVDAGNPATPGAGGSACTATDQRGAPRNCDIGAYELVTCQGITVNRVGTSGDDTLMGTDTTDGFLAGEGNDTATGLGGDDAFCLERGNDTSDGGDGDDLIQGGDGDDVATGGAGNDQILGETGNDTGDGGEGNDTFLGGDGNDRGKGGAGKDLLKGEKGKDRLNGGSGKDRLIGGGGKDKLNCGAGKKEIGKGGPGKDKAVKCEKGKA